MTTCKELYILEIVTKLIRKNMQITSSELTDLAYDLAEIGIHAKDSQDLENQVTQYLENFEADHQEVRETWNDLLALGVNIN